MSADGEGRRDRKRRETTRRIVEAGIGLFVANGYQATTIDQIAAAAGIARRTFFHYFRSKDDILLSMQSGMGETIAAAVRAAPRDARPLEAIRDAIVAVCAAVPADDMVAIDRVMRSSEAVQARKQASYVRHEEALYAALHERWPDPARAAGLRLLAMLAIGAMRLSLDTFHREGGERPIAAVLAGSFDALARETGAR